MEAEGHAKDIAEETVDFASALTKGMIPFYCQVLPLSPVNKEQIKHTSAHKHLHSE